MNDIIVQFARLWGQMEAYCSTPEEEKTAKELKAYDSQECLDLLKTWADEYENDPEADDTYEFFCDKVNVLVQRVPEILASTAKQKPVYTEKEVMAFWEQLEDVPMNPDTECMEEQFLHFPAGTPREDIWHWFDEIYPKGVHALLYGQN